MQCPLCSSSLEKALVSHVEVDYCTRCYGLWFEEDELRQAKDERDRSLRWLDVDLWDDPRKLRLSLGTKLCPVHQLPLYEVGYGDSDIKVDVCSLDKGVWLDRGEFKSIIVYLQDKQDYEILYHYLKNLGQETWEVFSGPEMLREEIIDVLIILKLFSYKFAAQHQTISQLMLALPK